MNESVKSIGQLKYEDFQARGLTYLTPWDDLPLVVRTAWEEIAIRNQLSDIKDLADWDD